MSWIILILILICYYWLCVTYSISPVLKPASTEPQPKTFRHEVRSENGQVIFLNSLGKQWVFDLDPSFFFHDGEIRLKNACFGKKDGFQVRAKGKELYDYVQREKWKDIGKTGQFQVHVHEAIQHRQLFYFSCRANQIEGLYTCPPGQLFDKTHCRPIHPCTHRPDGTTFADEFDGRFYYKCPDSRFQCPPNTYFLHDSCRPKNDFSQVCLHDPTYLLPVSKRTYLKCEYGVPKMYNCPRGTLFLNDRCVPDACYQQPDGSKVAFPKDKLGPFQFSSGYYICKDGQIEQSVECPSDWDGYDSKGDHLLFLPQVFQKGSCVVPEFCVNVTSDHSDLVVPSHDFTKNVKNWANSLLLDQSVGYRCEGFKKKLFIPAPGEHIQDFKSVSACDTPGKKVVLGRDFENYYDCDLKAVVACPKDSFFDGIHCQARIENAHRYRNVDMFVLDHLDNNNWMKAWSYSGKPKVDCTDPEYVYIYGYNICSHPECQNFPFLKQIKGNIQLDEQSKCVFQKGKLSKVETARREHFNFWTQRTSLQHEGCISGSKIKTGHFMLDSVLYATCETKQPFVFCPSSSTIGLVEVNGMYACNPNQDVFEGILKANTSQQYLENYLLKIFPGVGARVTINGRVVSDREVDGSILITEKTTVNLWSDQDLRLRYKMVMNYPPNTYFENNTLKAYRNLDTIFITRYDTGQTRNPVDFPSYNIKESVTGFQSDAT